MSEEALPESGTVTGDPVNCCSSRQMCLTFLPISRFIKISWTPKNAKCCLPKLNDLRPLSGNVSFWFPTHSAQFTKDAVYTFRQLSFFNHLTTAITSYWFIPKKDKWILWKFQIYLASMYTTKLFLQQLKSPSPPSVWTFWAESQGVSLSSGPKEESTERCSADPASTLRPSADSGTRINHPTH